jgi:hypothetical protein
MDLESLLVAPVVASGPGSNRTGASHRSKVNALPRVLWVGCSQSDVIIGAALVTQASICSRDIADTHFALSTFVLLQHSVALSAQDVSWRSSILHLHEGVDCRIRSAASSDSAAIGVHFQQFLSGRWHVLRLPDSELSKVRSANPCCQICVPSRVCRALGISAQVVDVVPDFVGNHLHEVDRTAHQIVFQGDIRVHSGDRCK